MNGLGRINLLVGTNNSGKTSLLEAILLLASRGDPNSITQILWRRGERLFPGEPDQLAPAVQPELDICHLFNGHNAHPGTKFQLFARNQSPERSVSFEITEPTKQELTELQIPRGTSPSRPHLVLHVDRSPKPPVGAIPINSNGGIPIDAIQGHFFRGRRFGKVSRLTPTYPPNRGVPMILYRSGRGSVAYTRRTPGFRCVALFES